MYFSSEINKSCRNLSDMNPFCMAYCLFCLIISYVVMSNVSLSSHNSKEKCMSAALRHNNSEDYSTNVCLDIPIIIDYENEELSDATDANYTYNIKTFRDNKSSYNELLTRNSNLDPNASIFNPHSSNTLIGEPSNLINVNNKDIYSILNEIRIKNIHRIIIGHLNINNSIRNKFNVLSDIIKNKIDIMLISETKIDGSFPNSIFSIDGFTPPYRGRGIILYVRDDIPSKELKAIYLSNDKEYIFIEINF